MRVTLLAPAAVEFIEAVAYYDAQAPGLGSAFEGEFSKAVRLVSENPGAGAPHRHDTRRVLLERFPYAVVYRALPDRVMVLAVAHLSRRPAYWAERL